MRSRDILCAKFEAVLTQIYADISQATIRYSKITGFIRLTKYRLGALVVFSALITYFTVAEDIQMKEVLALGIGGFLVTSAANGFNQVIEIESDRKMNRTKLRPLPTGVLKKSEALVFSVVAAVTGILLLWIYTNPLSGILGFASIILYSVIYTPLKKISPFSVFVGAFPGALPTLIGAVASTEGFGKIHFFAVLLFLIQFIWQFPHFWSLAWFNNEDYAKADFYLLPSRNGKDKASLFQILLYSFFLMFTSILPFVFGYTGIFSAAICMITGTTMMIQSYNFYRLGTDILAKKLFMVTLIYLPVVQLALMAKF